LTPEKTLTRNFKESGGKGKFRRRQLLSKYRNIVPPPRNIEISEYRNIDMKLAAIKICFFRLNSNNNTIFYF